MSSVNVFSIHRKISFKNTPCPSINFIILLTVTTASAFKSCLFQLLPYNNKSKNFFWKIPCPARKHTISYEFSTPLLLKVLFLK